MNLKSIVVFFFVSFGLFCGEMEPEESMIEPSLADWNKFIDELGPEYERHIELAAELNVLSSFDIARRFFSKGIDEETMTYDEALAYDILIERSKKHRAYFETNKMLPQTIEDRFFFRETFGVSSDMVEEDQDLTRATLDGMNFENAIFWGCKFLKIDVTNSLFGSALFIETTFDGSTFTNVNFDKIKAPNLQIFESVITDCSFIDAFLKMANIRESRLDSVTFNNANLNETYFSKNLCNVDLTKATICGLKLSRDISLQGTLTISGAAIDFVEGCLPGGDYTEYPAMDFFQAIGAVYDENNPPMIVMEPATGAKRTLNSHDQPDPKRKK